MGAGIGNHQPAVVNLPPAVARREWVPPGHCHSPVRVAWLFDLVLLSSLGLEKDLVAAESCRNDNSVLEFNYHCPSDYGPGRAVPLRRGNG